MWGRGLLQRPPKAWSSSPQVLYCQTLDALHTLLNALCVEDPTPAGLKIILEEWEQGGDEGQRGRRIGSETAGGFASGRCLELVLCLPPPLLALPQAPAPHSAHPQPPTTATPASFLSPFLSLTLSSSLMTLYLLSLASLTLPSLCPCSPVLCFWAPRILVFCEEDEGYGGLPYHLPRRFLKAGLPTSAAETGLRPEALSLALVLTASGARDELWEDP